MKRSRHIALAALLILVVGVAVTWALARSSSPEVPLVGDPENEDQEALRELFQTIGDPRELEDGEVVTLRLSQAQVSALAAEASRRRHRVSVRARLREGAIDVTVSAESPKPWLTPYLNLHASLRGMPDALRVESASLGNLPIPAALGQALFDHGLEELQARDPLAEAAMNAVEDLTYEADALTVEVRWTETVRNQIRSAGRTLVAQELGGDGLHVYTEVLRRTIEGTEGDALALVHLMQVLFAAAQQRVADEHPARDELEAALVVLTFYCLGVPLDEVLGEHAPPPLPIRPVFLHERTDLPRHFLVSAVATLFANRAVADALGLAKELRDRDDEDGSGFSFSDLAADRAGTRLMEEGTRTPAGLDALLSRLAESFVDADLVPDVEDLPEGMDAAAFRDAYQNVEGRAYASLVARIDASTDACAVHRAVANAQ